MAAINQTRMRSFVAKAVREVFSKMLSMKLDLLDPPPPATLEGERLIGSVGFSGEVVGVLNVHVTEVFARLMTGSAHGKKAEEINNIADVNDTIREVSNMIGGNFKSLLSENGFSCSLGVPSVERGGHFGNESMNGAQQERFVFRHPSHNTFVIVEARFS